MAFSGGKRWLVMQEAIKRCLEDEETESYQGFLFNDLLLLAKPTDKGKYTVINQIGLYNACLFDIPDVQASVFINAMQLVYIDDNRNQSITLIAETPKAKKQWFDAINDCLLSTTDWSKAIIKGDSLQETSMEGFIVLRAKTISHRRYARLKGKTLFLFKDAKVIVFFLSIPFDLKTKLTD